MSYDVFMQAFRNGGPGQGDREAALRLVRSLGERAEAHSSGFFVHFPDGGSAEISSSELVGEGEFVSTMFSIRGNFTHDLTRFIYAYAREANMVLIAPDESGKSATFACTREEQLAHIAELSGTRDCPKIVITTGDEVYRLLKEAYDEWLEFAQSVRKQIAEEGKRATRTKNR